MKTKQQLRDELAKLAFDTAREEHGGHSVTNLRGDLFLDTPYPVNMTYIADRIIDHLTPVMDEVVEALGYYAISRKAVGNLGTGEICDVFNGEKAQQAIERLSCWRGV